MRSDVRVAHPLRELRPEPVKTIAFRGVNLGSGVVNAMPTWSRCTFTAIASLRASARYAISNGNSFRRQIAHDPKKRQTSTGVTAEVNNQAAASVQFVDRAVDRSAPFHR